MLNPRFLMLIPWLLAACSDPQQLQGVVTDAWGKPVEGATVQLEGVVEQVTTDAKGLFQFEVKPGSLRVMAGKEGFIRNSAAVTVPEDEDEKVPKAEIALYPEPKDPGFYAVNRRTFDHLEAKKIATVGTEVKAFTGLASEGDVKVVGDKPIRFVFTSTLKSSELSRLNLQLHKLEFVDTHPVPGVLGETEVDIDLWIARESQEFDLKGLPSKNDYLIVTRHKLEPGTYAFHTEGVLTSDDVAALANTPKEMQVAYPFVVN